VNEKLAAAWERISLRTKLTTMSVALIGVLLVVSSVGTISLLRTYLQQNTDTLLTSTAAALSHESPVTLEARLASRQIVLPRLPSDYYIAYLDTDGTLILGLVSSTNSKQDVPNLSNFTLPVVMSTQSQPFEIKVKGRTSDVSLGTWRMIATPQSGLTGSVVIALPDSANAGLIQQYGLIGSGFGILLLVVSAIAIWMTISSALRPLREVERTAKAVAEGDTSQRLVEHYPTTELGRLSNSLNTMLSSIDGAMNSRNKTLDQMRRFVADASHELRTPLVTLRGYAELYRIGALKEKSDVADAMSRIESEAIRMTELVENLLALARMDEATPLKTESINLTEIAETAAGDAKVNASDIDFALIGLDGKSLIGADPVYAQADAASIRQVLTNLLANAARFSKPGSSIEIVLGNTPTHTVLEVRDHGEGIPSQLREKVFERFYRADNSRNRETGGSGLGLSIVKTIIDRHRGAIMALETNGGGATFRVELPLR
jgi:two-component system, OmpR family, sensor kinase